jgi:MFS family permease
MSKLAASSQKAEFEADSLDGDTTFDQTDHIRGVSAPPEPLPCGWGRSDPLSSPRLFYGWVVVLGAGLIRIASAPGHTFGINMFVEHFISDIGVSRVGVSWVWLFASLFSGACVPLAGALLDWAGARATLRLVLAPYFIVLLAMSVVQTPVQLGLLVAAMRFLGPECLSLTASVSVNLWFVKRRGAATALLSSFAVLLRGLPPIMGALIARLGWRGAYRFLAFFLSANLVTGMLLIRDNPQRHGLLPDGGASESLGANRGKRGSGYSRVAPSGEAAAIDEKPETMTMRTSDAVSLDDIKDGASLGDALRTPVFWAIAASNCVFGMFWSGFNYYVVDHLALVAGLDGDAAARAIFFPLTLSITACSFATGVFWIDHLGTAQRVRQLGAVCIILSGTMMLSDSITGAATAAVWSVVYGAGVGAKDAFYQVLYADLFGSRALGKISGVATALGIASTGVGPLLFGWCRQATGTYTLITFGLALALAATAFPVWFVQVPKAARGGRSRRRSLEECGMEMGAPPVPSSSDDGGGVDADDHPE